MTLYKEILYTVGLGLILSSTTLVAADLSARDIVNNAYKYVGSLDKYAFDAVVVDRIQDGEVRNNVSVKVDRPDRLRVDVKGTHKDRTTYFNDGHFTMIDHNFGYYGQLETPKSIDGALDFIFAKYGILAPLASLVYSDMQKRAKINNSKYFGIVDVDGVKCHYIAFGKKRKEIHVWIEAGEKPLVKTYTIIEKIGNNTERIDTTIKWSKKPKISDSDFVFKAPRGATKISVRSAN